MNRNNMEETIMDFYSTHYNFEELESLKYDLVSMPDAEIQIMYDEASAQLERMSFFAELFDEYDDGLDLSY